MKNERTPRTLAETTFTSGYPRVPRQRSTTFWDLLGLAVILVSMAACGVMLATAF